MTIICKEKKLFKILCYPIPNNYQYIIYFIKILATLTNFIYEIYNYK